MPSEKESFEFFVREWEPEFLESTQEEKPSPEKSDPAQREALHQVAFKQPQILEAPVTGNSGGVTSVFLQYNEVEDSDGHFVIFDRDDAETQYGNFLGTLARTGSATLVRP